MLLCWCLVIMFIMLIIGPGCDDLIISTKQSKVGADGNVSDGSTIHPDGDIWMSVLNLTTKKENIFIYRASGKYSQRFIFFHILLCYSLIPKWIKFIIFLNILHTKTHNDKVKTVFCKFIKIKKRKHNMYISIHSLCSILCWSTFGSNYSLKFSWVW